MRDLVLALFVFGSIPFILWRPVFGVFLWVWVSVMNPHRLTWDFAYDLPVAQAIAVATLIGFLFSQQPKRPPLTPVTVVLLLFVAWMNVTTLLAMDPSRAIPAWERAMKIQLMVFVAIAVLKTAQQVQVLVMVLAASLGFFAVKGGFFTLITGGDYRVWGPPESFISDNNSMALATIMTIPLLRYLQLQATNRWVRWALGVCMVLAGFAVLGSQSRGALLGIIAMLAFLWVKSRGKMMTGIALLCAIPLAIGFMPDKWDERMSTIQNYEQDPSALGRINAWGMAVNLANDRPLVGGGFELYNADVFARYAANPADVRSAHSIYFQVLGEQGYVGLLLFLFLWLLAWRDAAWISLHTLRRPDLQWASHLARMIQVSLVGYAVGGAFLNLAYWDVPYYLIVALVVTRVIVRTSLKNEPARASQRAERGATGLPAAAFVDAQSGKF